MTALGLCPPDSWPGPGRRDGHAAGCPLHARTGRQAAYRTRYFKSQSRFRYNWNKKSPGVTTMGARTCAPDAVPARGAGREQGRRHPPGKLRTEPSPPAPPSGFAPGRFQGGFLARQRPRPPTAENLGVGTTRSRDTTELTLLCRHDRHTDRCERGQHPQRQSRTPRRSTLP